MFEDSLSVESTLGNDLIKDWILYFNYGDKWEYNIFSSLNDEQHLPLYSFSFKDSIQTDGNIEKIRIQDTLRALGISSVNKFGTESEIRLMELPEKTSDIY